MKRAKTNSFLYELLPKVVHYHDWLASNRHFEADGLIRLFRPLNLGSIGSHHLMRWLDIARSDAERLVHQRALLAGDAKVDAVNYLANTICQIHKRDAFLVKEVAYNTIYACDVRALADLCGYRRSSG